MAADATPGAAASMAMMATAIIAGRRPIRVAIAVLPTRSYIGKKWSILEVNSGTPEWLRAACGARERRGRPIALLAVVAPEAVEHGEDARGADRVAPLERPARVVESKRHARVDVLGRADALAEREARLVHELADDAAQHEARRAADPLDVAPERGEEALGGGRRGAGGRGRAGELDERADRRGGEEADVAVERHGVAQGDARTVALDRDATHRGAHLPAGLPRRRAQLLGQRFVARDRERPVASTGRRRVGVLGPVRAVLGVLVPAAAGLAAVAPRGRHALGERGGPPARLAVGLLVERLRDLEADVDAHEIHQLERAHREAAAQPADAVHLLRGGQALLHEPQRLQPERAVAAVDQEAGDVGGLDRVLAHRLAGGAGTLDGLLGGRLACHHLDQ